MQSISIIIPNYNGQAVLSENLPKIITLAQKYSAPIIIVDDYSRDDSVTWLKSNYADRITLIEKPTNEGFSSTVNLGVQHANTDLIFLLNSDAIPHFDALDYIFPYYTDPQVFSVGLQDIDDDQKNHGQGKFIFHEGFLLHQGGDLLADHAGHYPTGWVSCGSGVFRRSTWIQLNGLTTLYNPFYFEDVDLGYRSWKAGFQNYFEPRSLCDHLHKKGAIKSNYDEKRIRTISIRNQYFFSWLNLTDQALIKQHLSSLPRHLLRAIIQNDQPFLKGLFQALSSFNLVRSERKNRVQFKAKTDQELLNL